MKRPRRGSPEETRRRLVEAAAEVFNRDGYAGTDTNRLARAAGYAAGTFYKHFADKRAIFLAVYADWVSGEWAQVNASLERAGGAGRRAERIVAIFLEHHRRWRVFRASLRALVPVDPAIRDFQREQRRMQLHLLEGLRQAAGAPPASREEDALLLLTVERAADAVADGEVAALGLRMPRFRALLVELLQRPLKGI